MSKSKTITKNKITGGRYGLLTMISMIVGTVIGSGIFIRNEGMFNSTNSALINISAWLIISLLIIFMVVAFIEIFSITKRTGEQGTVGVWGKHLIGPRFQKLAGIFFPLVYMPVLMTALSMYGADQFAKSMYEVSAGADAMSHTQKFYFVTGLTFAFLLLPFLLNLTTIRGGKAVQNIGTFIKITPLVMVIVLGSIAMVAPSVQGHYDHSMKDIWDPNSAINAGLRDANGKNLHGWDIFQAALLVMPSVMFSFDGFLGAASLQNEGRKKNTYKIALVTGIMFIAIIYVVMSLFSYLLAFNGDESQLTIGVAAIIGNFFEKNYNETTGFAMKITSFFIIWISIMTGLSGNSIASFRQTADLSANNIVDDRDGVLVTRRANGVPFNAGLRVMGATFIWALIAVWLDITLFHALPYEATDSYHNVVDFGADLITIIAYTLYLSLIFAAIRNRSTNKVQTDRTKGFMFSAVMSFLGVAFVNIVFFIQLLIPYNIKADDAVSWSIWAAKITYTILLFYVWFSFANRAEKARKKMNWKSKQKQQLASKVYLGTSLQEATREFNLANEGIRVVAPKARGYMGTQEFVFKETDITPMKKSLKKKPKAKVKVTKKSVKK